MIFESKEDARETVIEHKNRKISILENKYNILEIQSGSMIKKLEEMNCDLKQENERIKNEYKYNKNILKDRNIRIEELVIENMELDSMIDSLSNENIELKAMLNR